MIDDPKAMTLTIAGHAIRDIASFYDEINRVFMAGEDWSLGPSLDALDDLFYGSYGALAGKAPVILVWQDIETSRAALGIAATRAHLRAKLQNTAFDAARITAQLDALEKGSGETYFDTILTIIADHPNIHLVRA